MPPNTARTIIKVLLAFWLLNQTFREAGYGFILIKETDMSLEPPESIGMED